MGSLSKGYCSKADLSPGPESSEWMVWGLYGVLVKGLLDLQGPLRHPDLESRLLTLVLGLMQGGPMNKDSPITPLGSLKLPTAP